MKTRELRKILILDQGDPVAAQILSKMVSTFGTDGVGYVILKACRTHNIVLDMMEKAICDEEPELVLIGATALGEETAPALGVRLRTGVCAHCADIKINDEGRMTYIVPALGGKAFCEIFVPEAKAGQPAVVTVKPGIFSDPDGWDYEEVIRTADWCKVIDVDAMTAEGIIPEGSKTQGTFRLANIEPRVRAAGDITKADLIICGGYGLGSEEVWHKLEKLADRLGGAAACTRAALDAGWGCLEDSMIGTSGKAVRPKVYVGLGISGAAHHTCGIAGAGTIININTDKDADAFAVSDYKGVFDAERVLDALLDEIG